VSVNEFEIHTSFQINAEIERERKIHPGGSFAGIHDDALIEFMEQYESGELNSPTNQNYLITSDDNAFNSELIVFMNNLETSLIENDLIAFMETFEANDVERERTIHPEGSFAGIHDDALIEFMEQYEGGELNSPINQNYIVTSDESSFDSELIAFMDNLETSLIENDLIAFIETFEADDK
jgi:Rps23 Pro-64 3,4-dihydroxylase Tpa1-like proline 4-hydroxylase